jgi:prepilin signal peptidase PulO-like enzyme (type II secretory pathway)
MIGWWLSFSMELRLLAIGLLGLLICPIINWAIYNAAYFPLPISPWNRRRFSDLVRKHFEEVEKQASSKKTNPSTKSSKKSQKSKDHASAGDRHQLLTEATVLNPPAASRIPVLGWLWLKHEDVVFGTRFWLRPLLLELLFPAFLAWLYYFEVTGGLLPPLAWPQIPALQNSLHVQYICHSVLCCLMVVATFIDFDERTIPDWVTIPGTIFGVLLTTMLSLIAPTHLWTSAVDNATKSWPTVLDWTSPFQAFNSFSVNQQLLFGMLCWALWCFAIADRRVRLRRGWKKAIQFFFAGLVRRPAWKLILSILLIGELMIVLGWRYLPQESWQSCLTSLIGMAIGGILVWVVRIVATTAMGMEALGFGDVTLMFMVGAFLGWQPTWIAFFVAPMVAICFVVVLYLITGDNQLPFGPYLCVGTLLTLLGWDALWNVRMQPMVAVIGFEMLVLLTMGLLLMGLMLWSWRMMKSRYLTP